MNARRFELVARVAKARGLEGKVTAVQADGLPFCLHEGMRVHVVPPTLYGPRELTVASVEEMGGCAAVAFEEVRGIEAAEELSGRQLLASIEDINLGAGEQAATEVGRTVVDERYGELGRITEVFSTPAHDIWVVEGPLGEVLLPVVEEFVACCPNPPDEPIETRIPEGLVEL